VTDLFVDRLIDWKAFERFVADVYAEDPDLVVEHNVTDVGKSGARRQIDVKFTHTVKAHTYVTIVECKRWKEKVDRDRIDVLAATIEDLNAAKGVMFTTTGFEPSAEAYAKQKGIDLFLVRDLTDAEWGLPGRVVWFYLHFYGAQITAVAPRQAQLIATVPDPPSSVSLELVFRPDGQLDEAMTLRSIVDGSAGPNLLTLVAEARLRALHWLSRSVGLLDAGGDSASRAFVIPLVLNLAGSPYRDLPRQFGLMRLRELAMDLTVSVTQSRFEHDRGKGLDLALAVENYVTRQRSVVTRQTDSSDVVVQELTDPQSTETDGDVLENGTLMRIFLEPSVAPDALLVTPERTAAFTVALTGSTMAAANA
jgi:hypothetical protein